MNVTRPTPVGNTKRGGRAYAGAHLGAYRRSNGISQEDLAANLGVTREAVTMAERREVGESVAVRFLDAVDYLVRRREEMVASGVAAARRHGLVAEDER